MTTLKPCIYCGGEAVKVAAVLSGTGGRRTVCPRCHASGPICASEADAVEVHNTRWEKMGGERMTECPEDCPHLRRWTECEEFWGAPACYDNAECEYLCDSPDDLGCPRHEELTRKE